MIEGNSGCAAAPGVAGDKRIGIVGSDGELGGRAHKGSRRAKPRRLQDIGGAGWTTAAGGDLVLEVNPSCRPGAHHMSPIGSDSEYVCRRRSPRNRGIVADRQS